MVRGDAALSADVAVHKASRAAWASYVGQSRRELRVIDAGPSTRPVIVGFG
jgi:hypothetical protein